MRGLLILETLTLSLGGTVQTSTLCRDYRRLETVSQYSSKRWGNCPLLLFFTGNALMILKPILADFRYEAHNAKVMRE